MKNRAEYYDKLMAEHAKSIAKSARAPLIDKLEKCHQEKKELIDALKRCRSGKITWKEVSSIIARHDK